MAWVRVHDTVDGSKLREFAKSINCTKEEALGALVSLWIWGLKNADIDGRLPGADRDDILDAFSTKFVSRAPNVVDALVETNWIDSEEDALVIHDWSQWQAQWYKAVERRKKDAERKARKCAEIKSEIDTKSDGKSADDERPQMKEIPVSENLSFLEESNPEPKPKASKYSTGFEAFWSVYPRKIDKGNAYKKYSARRNDGYSDEELLKAATNYALECKKLHTESSYIKHPKTFLSDSLPFTDYLKKDAPAQQKFGLPESGNPYEEDDWSDEP